MRYQFPRIEHIDDVRSAIEGRDEFIIAERDWGYVVNYLVSMTDTFPPVTEDEYWCPGCKQLIKDIDHCGSQRCPESVNLAAIRRECRGLLFHKDGTIMSRRLHKFFNINEREETQFDKIDFGYEHVILEKLDGSMITPIPMNKVPDEPFQLYGEEPTIFRTGDLRWGTKMGITEVSMQAEEFVAKNPQYERFARWCIDWAGVTPIFEWCSRKQRIVVDYPEDRLVLIAARNNVDGQYMTYGWMIKYAAEYGIDRVKSYYGNARNMKALMEETRDSEGIEGWIVRFYDGHMIKVKGEWYLRIHKTKDNLTHEKNVVDLIVNEKIDDAKAFMLEEDRKRVEAFETEFWEGVASSVDKYDKYWLMVQNSGLDRKGYAQNWMPTIKAQDPLAPSIIFGKFDGKDTRTMILDAIKKSTGSQTKIDAARYLWEGARWTYHFEGDA
jgi:RNA ligase